MLKVKLKRQIHDLIPTDDDDVPTDAVPQVGVKRKKIDISRLEDETKWLIKQEMQVKQLEEIQRIRNEEHKRLVFALKNQRQRLHYEKMAELTQQKEMFERLICKCKIESSEKTTSKTTLKSPVMETSDVELKEEKNVVCVDLDQKTVGLRLLRSKYKNKMLSPCRSYSWRTKDLHLSAMTPIEEEEEDCNWFEEKKRLNRENEELKEKLWSLEQRQTRLEVDLQEARDQNDLLEFRILEVEQNHPNTEGKSQDKSVNTDSSDGLLIKEFQVEDTLLEKIRNLEAECSTLRSENKNLSIKFISASQISTSTQESLTDSMFDNRSDVVSQGGETGYSSDEYDDTNPTLSNADVTSPTPSIDSANAIEFEDIVQKISGLNTENSIIANNNFPGSLEELNSRNKTSRVPCNDFFWSLSEVAHKIKESEEVKNKLRSHVRSLEDELRRVTGERDELKRGTNFQLDEKLNFSNAENNREEINLDTCDVDVLKNMLSMKENELRNKELEYSLKIEALKCDLDENVNRLETRLETSLKTEMEFREKIESLEQEKKDLMDRMREKEEEVEMDKISMLSQIRNLQQAKEKLEERIVTQNNRTEAKRLFTVSDEIVYGDDAEEKIKEKVENLNDIEDTANEFDDSGYNEDGNECQTENASNKQLQQRLFELEKKERAYRETLHEADKIMADVERSYQERIDEQEAVEERLRARIVQLEQSEKRLRQALRNTKHNSEVSKFGELLDRLLETEASERRLKGRIHELEKDDKELKMALMDAQRDKYVVEQELQDQEELLRLVSDLRLAEKELKIKIAQLETSESALKETLAQADAILMEREMALKEKVELLETELTSLKQEREEYERIIRDQHPNRVQSMADVVNSNAKLELQIEELEETNKNLRQRLFQLESENTISNKNSSEENSNDLCLKLNLEILDRDYQIEKLSEKIKFLEAGNIPMELQALSLHADELKQLKEKINSLSSFVQHCNCGNCSICQPLLADIENQVKLLDEIISGNSVDMKEEKRCLSEGCQTQDLISLNDDNVDSAAHKENASVPMETCDIMGDDLQERNRENSENITLQFQNNKIKKGFYKNKFNYCSIEEIDELKTRISQLEKELTSKEKLHEVTDQQKKALQIKLSICEKDVSDRLAEISKLSAEKMMVQQENESLQHRVWKSELSERVLQEKYLKKSQAAVSGNKQVRELEQKVGVLTRQLRHWESSHREVANYKEKIQELESELQKRRENERKLYAENLHLHHKVESQRERINSMQVMKKDYQMLNNKIDLLEKKKLIVEQSIPSLKSKISQLSQRCKDKDQIINRLDKQIQNKMTPFKEQKQNTNRNSNNNNDETQCDKEQKFELRNDLVPYISSLNHSTSSDNSDCSISPRQNGNKSKIPRYTALPSPIPSPRNRTVQFQKNAWEDDKSNKQVRPKLNRKTQRIKRNSGNEEKHYEVEDEHSFAPFNFRVTRKVASDSLLVAWSVPDTMNNMSGYLIYANNELHQKVRSPNRTKALLNRLDLTNDIEIAIQALLDNGASSEKIKCLYKANQTDENYESPPTSARSLDEKCFKNYKRQCVVCKDYKPSDLQDNKPTLELKVNKGDIVTIFGSKSANNFYYAEADGKRGILPDEILEKISSHKTRKGVSIAEIHSD